MKTTLSKAELDEQVMMAKQIAEACGFYFNGRDPGVIGSALSQLMATYITNFQSSDRVHGAAKRAELMAQWCATVWQMVDEIDSNRERMN